MDLYRNVELQSYIKFYPEFHFMIFIYFREQQVEKKTPQQRYTRSLYVHSTSYSVSPSWPCPSTWCRKKSEPMWRPSQLVSESSNRPGMTLMMKIRIIEELKYLAMINLSPMRFTLSNIVYLILILVIKYAVIDTDL